MFSQATFDSSSAGVEVVLPRVGSAQGRKTEQGRGVTVVSIRVGYATYGGKEKTKGVEK